MGGSENISISKGEPITNKKKEPADLDKDNEGVANADVVFRFQTRNSCLKHGSQVLEDESKEGKAHTRVMLKCHLWHT